MTSDYLAGYAAGKAECQGKLSIQIENQPTKTERYVVLGTLSCVIILVCLFLGFFNR